MDEAYDIVIAGGGPVGAALAIALSNSGYTCALCEARPADTGGPMPAYQIALRVLSDQLVDEQVLHDDHVTFQAHDLGNVGDAARTVAQTRGLDDDIDRSADHFPDRSRRQREAAHGDHRLQSGKAFARVVGMERAHRAIVAGVHGLQQIERLRSADLADDDALRPHAQAVLDEIAHRHLAFPFEVGRARFKAHDMRLLELEFGSVLTGDDAFVEIDIAGETIEERRLA